MSLLRIALLAAAAAATLAGCSTTGSIVAGAGSDSAPAQKTLKGEIRSHLYTAQDKSFSVMVPHKKEGVHEYAPTQIKEEFTKYGAYVSFGPATFDQSVYRVEVVKDTASGKKTNLDEIAPKLIEDYKAQLQKDYESAPRKAESRQETINGRKAYYWELTQVAPAGKYASNKATTITHEVYIINFDKGAAIIWVLIPETAKKAAIAPQAFAESVAMH
ncbi:MAG: hypothetical protein OEV35_10110 [Gallionellaceae bacterium]|nr:hypothetical protein [Gallionellaceae bacterium]